MKTMIDLFQLMRMDEPGAPVANEWIQIMKVGKFEYKGKDIEITQDDLNEFAENFQNRVRGVDLAVDVSHRPEDGSVGWFEGVKAEPGKLMAKIKWTNEGEEFVGSGKFRYFSPEWHRQWTDTETKKTFQNVLFGGALTNRPFLKNMEPVGIAMSEDGESTITVWADGSDNESSSSSVYDPDGDGDDDSTTDPDKNPDWIDDVQRGHTPFDKAAGRQQQMLARRGITKEKADGARQQFLSENPQHKNQQFEDRTTNTSQRPTGTRVTMTETEFNSFLVLLFAEGDVTNAHQSPPKGKPQDKGQYADPVNYKYPIDEKHIHAAVSYFNQGGQQASGGYSPEQWSTIGGRIAAAANKLIGPGHSFKDGKIETPSNSSKPKEMDEPGTTGTKNLNPGDGSSVPNPIDDGEAGKFSEHHNPNGGGSMPVSDEQYNTLLAEVNLLKADKRKTMMAEKVDTFIRAGKVVPAQRDNMIATMSEMSDEAAVKFAEIFEKNPQVVTFSEEGFSGDPGTPDGEVLLDELTQQYIGEGKTPRVAASMAFSEVEKRGIKLDY